MSKNEKMKNSPVVKPAGEVVEIKKNRIAIFFSNWKQVFQYAPQTNNHFVKNYHLGQIIFDEKLIFELLHQNAPIKVYIEDVD